VPIEIKELVIRAIVDSSVDEADGRIEEQTVDEIVKTCVREVLRVLRRAEER